MVSQMNVKKILNFIFIFFGVISIILFIFVITVFFYGKFYNIDQNEPNFNEIPNEILNENDNDFENDIYEDVFIEVDDQFFDITEEDEPEIFAENTEEIVEEEIIYKLNTEEPNKNTDEFGKEIFIYPSPLLIKRSEELQALIAPETEYADDDYFQNTVFFGDSMIACLQRYVTKIRKSGNEDFMNGSHFISSINLGAANSQKPITETSWHPVFNGEKQYPQDILEQIEDIEKIYIMLGINDIGFFEIDEYLYHYSVMLEAIREKLPEITVIILPITPHTHNGERKYIFNYKIEKYNNSLIKFAYENRCYFVDVAEILKDKTGYIPINWTYDDRCHLSDIGNVHLIDYIRTHAIYEPFMTDEERIAWEIMQQEIAEQQRLEEEKIEKERPENGRKKKEHSN